MKIYFYSANINKQVNRVVDLLKKTDLQLFSNLFLKNKQDIFSDHNLYKSDHFILFMKDFDAKIFYIISFALSRKKRVICLLPKNIKIDDNFKSLQNSLEIYFYDEHDLNFRISNIISSLQIKNKNNLFNIKYTLRLSAKISDYLNWKAEQINMSGADWLRQMIQENMDNDKDYQAVLKNKYKV